MKKLVLHFKKLVITVLKMKKKFNIPTNILFQKYLIRMLQHHQHLQNFTDQLHVHIFAKLIPAPTAKNLKIKKHHMFKNLLKRRGNEFDSS